MQSQAAGIDGQGPALNAFLGQLDPFVNDLQQVSATLQSQNGAVKALVRNTGIVFDALSQRQNQLRDLTTASLATFSATAAASHELAQAFTLLPTFETRSAQAFRALDQFAANSSPLLTQLVPAEQALVPVAQNLEAISPSLERLTVGLGPFGRASNVGLPALNDVLHQLTPLLTASQPVLRNLNPLLAYLDLYQPEIEAGFANAAAASQNRQPVSPELQGNSTELHILRAVGGPLQPSSNGLQSKTYGVTRTNAYPSPGVFTQLANGLATLTPASCSNPTPGAVGPPNALISAATLVLLTNLQILGSGANGTTAAPPCKGQAPQTFQGLTGLFPHVLAATH
jgi:hypothetical protein